MNGGDRDAEKTGKSLRYGINVPFSEHVTYLEKLGMAAEKDESGEYLGFEEDNTDPLSDNEHAFKTYYSKQANMIFNKL